MGTAAIDAVGPLEGPILGIPGDPGAGVESQRAMIAAKIANLPNGVRKDESAGRSIELPTSQADAASLMNVSVPSLKRAKSVQEHGTKELVKAVENVPHRRFGHHGQDSRPDRVPMPSELDIVQGWSYWDLKIAIARLDR
jgi:hypothetical protein